MGTHKGVVMAKQKDNNKVKTQAAGKKKRSRNVPKAPFITKFHIRFM